MNNRIKVKLAEVSALLSKIGEELNLELVTTMGKDLLAAKLSLVSAINAIDDLTDAAAVTPAPDEDMWEASEDWQASDYEDEDMWESSEDFDPWEESGWNSSNC